VRFVSRVAVVLSFLGLAGPSLFAQPAAPAQAPPPPPPFSGSFGAGLTLTRGNVDTTNVNLSFDAKYTASPTDAFKAEGLYLRGRTDGRDTANRLFLQGRFERLVTPRAFLFGQLQYVRDPFKAVDYLVAPTVGAGYKIVDTPATQFAVDTSVGVVWEKAPVVDVKTSPAWTAGEKLSHKLSASATVVESAQALWKLNDFGDTLYTLGAGLETTITVHSQLKAELRDTYKTAPPAGTQSNDLALVLSVVFKY
jgi:putative salt-induced outer membrane protein